MDVVKPSDAWSHELQFNASGVEVRLSMNDILREPERLKDLVIPNHTNETGQGAN